MPSSNPFGRLRGSRRARPRSPLGDRPAARRGTPQPFLRCCSPVRPSTLDNHRSSRRTLRARGGVVQLVGQRVRVARAASRLPRPRPRCRSSSSHAARDGLAVRPAGSASLVHAAVRHRRRRRRSPWPRRHRSDRPSTRAPRPCSRAPRSPTIGDELRAAGLALHNQGDIDTQTVSGATGTGTHGTGPDLGNLSTAIAAVASSTADGEIVPRARTSAPGLYQAARLSLGALGIITAITFRCVPAYNLHERVWFEGPDESLEQLADAHRGDAPLRVLLVSVPRPVRAQGARAHQRAA